LEARKMENSAQTKLDGEKKLGNVTIDGQDISAVPDNLDEQDILGWITIYTVGPQFRVNRAWLEENAAELGIPAQYLPSETSPRRAFTRTMNRGSLDMTEIGVESQSRYVEVDFWRDNENKKMFHMEVSDRRDGESHSEDIGQIEYDDGALLLRPSTDNPEYLDLFAAYDEWVKSEFETMKESNLGKDIRKMVREFASSHTPGVKMRDGGAVYFVPAHYGDHLMAFKELMDRVNDQWKDLGHACRIDTVEVLDSAEKQQMVKRQVDKEIRSRVESVLDEAFDQLNENAAAQEVVADLAENDEFARANTLAEEHNALLSVEVSVREVLEEWKENVTQDDKELVIDSAMSNASQ
jgi:hypothetical protein